MIQFLTNIFGKGVVETTNSKSYLRDLSLFEGALQWGHLVLNIWQGIDQWITKQSTTPKPLGMVAE